MDNIKRQDFHCVRCGQDVGRARLSMSSEKELDFSCPNEKCAMSYRVRIPDEEHGYDASIEILSGKGDFEVLFDDPEQRDGKTAIKCVFCGNRSGNVRRTTEAISQEEIVQYYRCVNLKCKKDFSISGA